MHRKKSKIVIAAMMASAMLQPGKTAQAAQTLYDNSTGTQDGYSYELWKDYGTTSMTLNSGGTFSCSWSNIGNALFRKGVKFNSTQTYQQIGNISCEYGCNYQPNGNSYLCVYGWTQGPLVEYYIVDSWGSWRPPGSSSKGTINVDGGTYDVYETTRVNQPSIEGTSTFQQYWSVRTSKRTSGTITVSDHFRTWESRGMQMGRMYEVALTVEGYQSSGTADVYKNNITVGTSGGNTNPTNPTNPTTGTFTATSTIEAEDYTSNSGSNMQTFGLSSGGSAIGYIENGYSITFKNVDFGSGVSGITMRAATENNTNIDLCIGSASGTKIGTIAVSSTGSWDTYKNVTADVSSVTGVKDLVLVFSGAVNVDSFKFTGASSSTDSTNPVDPDPEVPAGSVSASSTIQAESYSSTNASNNIRKFDISGSNQGVGYIENGNTLTYKDVDLGTGVSQFTANVATSNSTSIQIRANSASGTLLGTLSIGSTGSWDTYQQKSTTVSSITGVHDLVLVFSGAVNVDWFTFGNTGSGNINPGGNGGNNQQPDYQGKKLVALTFDDGPSSITSQVLDKLEQYDAVATFFLIGQNINEGSRAIMQRQVSMGCELANHSYSHNYMNSMDYNSAAYEVSRTSDLIYQYAGVRPKFFRPPYISTSNTMYQAIDLPFICGSMHNDWDNGTSASQRANSVISNVKDGDIILLHDFYGNGNTVQALDTIIPWLKNNGYELVTLSQLFELKGINPNQEYKIWSNVLS